MKLTSKQLRKIVNEEITRLHKEARDYEKDVLQVGQRVKLLANEEEGWGEEFGKVVEYEGVGLYLVLIDKKYRTRDDDGMREVLRDDLEKA